MSAPAPQKRLYIKTYGCQMNVYDSERMADILAPLGYAMSPTPQGADLVVLNTCHIREKATEKVYSELGQIRLLKLETAAAGGTMTIVVAGCVAQAEGEEIMRRQPAVDLVVGPQAYHQLPELIARTHRARGERLAADFASEAKFDALPIERRPTGVTAFLTVQEGCDKFCTFCVVPYTRGRERGGSPREILRQARGFAEAGFKEVQLLGQTVNSYRHEDVTFADLLRAVAAIDGIERVRFSSPYPLDFSPAVIAAMAESPKICKHVHLPLQSASDAVLDRMRRGYSYGDFRALVAALRAAMPEIAITTDLLIGFCDESDAEFAETLQAQADLRFDSAFMFAYSEREGTYAGRKMPDTVSAEVKQARLAEVIAKQQKITGEILSSQIGKRERVLVGDASKRNAKEFLAHTDGFRLVIVPEAPGVARGELVDVVIERATSKTLFGRVAGPV